MTISTLLLLSIGTFSALGAAHVSTLSAHAAERCVDADALELTSSSAIHSETRWGQIGHYATGHIATQYLSKKAKAAVDRILEGESIAVATVYMDDVRSDRAYDSYGDWHWVTIEDGKTYEESEKNPKGDIIHGIETLTAELKKGGLTPAQEKEKVKFLMHLIGDIHMPLHVGKGDDRGGNAVRVQWFSDNSNLHRVWDSDMINSRQLSYSELAESIKKPGADVVRQWQSTGPRDWAYESMSYREQVYDVPENARLGYEYRYKYFHIVEKRLLQAGIRIAGVLNELYGS